MSASRPQCRVDLKANHAFEISGVKANIYLLVINLFDKLNVVNFDKWRKTAGFQ